MQLIFISTLAIAYLAVTSTTGSNRTKTEQREAVNGYETNGKIDVEAIASHTTALGLELDSESRTSLKTALVAGMVNSSIKTETVVERVENEGGSAVEGLLFGREALKSDGLSAQRDTFEDVWMPRQSPCSVTNSQC